MIVKLVPHHRIPPSRGTYGPEHTLSSAWNGFGKRSCTAASMPCHAITHRPLVARGFAT